MTLREWIFISKPQRKQQVHWYSSEMSSNLFPALPRNCASGSEFGTYTVHQIINAPIFRRQCQFNSWDNAYAWEEWWNELLQGHSAILPLLTVKVIMNIMKCGGFITIQIIIILSWISGDWHGKSKCVLSRLLGISCVLSIFNFWGMSSFLAPSALLLSSSTAVIFIFPFLFSVISHLLHCLWNPLTVPSVVILGLVRSSAVIYSTRNPQL